MTVGIKTKEAIQLNRISLKTTTIGERSRTSIVGVETFHSSVILGTETQILIIPEIKTSTISDGNVLISNEGRIYRRGECSSMFTSID
jgi:hypothetical protein